VVVSKDVHGRPGKKVRALMNSAELRENLPMGLHISNDRTVQLVRELARRTSPSQSAAVEMAVRAKLAELEAVQRRSARRAEVSILLSELDSSLAGQKSNDQQELYDDHGLPV
jgi:antitoxin VapB